MDIVRGNQTLFMRSDEVLAAWDFIDPILYLTKDMEAQHIELEQWVRRIKY